MSDTVRPTDEAEGKSKKVKGYLEGGGSQSDGFFDKELAERLAQEALVEPLVLKSIGGVINRRSVSWINLLKNARLRGSQRTIECEFHPAAVGRRNPSFLSTVVMPRSDGWPIGCGEN